MEDFHRMSRRDLQALCKKHHIPGNSTNSLMAERLTALFSKGSEDPVPLGPSCLKGSGGSGGQGDGYCTRSKRKRVTFLLPEGDPDLEGASDRSDPVGKNLPELASTVPVPRTTRSRAARLQGDAVTAIPTSDVRSTRRGAGARALEHHSVDRSKANIEKEDSGNCADDAGLGVGKRSLRHRVVVTAVVGAPRRSRRRRDPGLIEAATAAAAPDAVPVPEAPNSSEVGGRRGSRKRHQDPVLVMTTSNQGNAPAAENVPRDEADKVGPRRRSKRNHRNPEGAMAVRGAPETGAPEISEVGVEVEKEGAAQILRSQRPSRRKSVKFQSEEVQDGVHTDAVGNKFQRRTRNSAPEEADEGSPAPTGESENFCGALDIAKKPEEVTQDGPLRWSKRNASNRYKLVSDILSADGGKSNDDDDGKVTEAMLPNKLKRQTTKRGAAFARENGKITGYLEVQANHTGVSDYDEPSKWKIRKSVKCDVAVQKVSLPPVEKQDNDKSLVENGCFAGTRSQKLDKAAPKVSPSVVKTSDENEVLENVEESAELSQLGETPKELKYQSSKDTSDQTKQEQMGDGLVHNSNGGLCPKEQFLGTGVPLEESKASGEPDKRGIQHEDDWSKEDRKKSDFQNFVEDRQVSCIGSPNVDNKSDELSDQVETEKLPGLPPSIRKEIVENSHANKKGSVGKHCDAEGRSSFKGSSKETPHGYHCSLEDGGPNYEPHCSKLNKHVICDSDVKTSPGVKDVQSSPGIHGPSPVSAAYNQDVAPVGDDEALPLPDASERRRRADATTQSPSVHDQGMYSRGHIDIQSSKGSESHGDLLSTLLLENKDEEVPGEAIAATLSSAQSFKPQGQSPGSDGMRDSGFRTDSISDVRDDQGSGLDVDFLTSLLMQSGDEKPDEAVEATLPRTRWLQKECKTPSSGGCDASGYEVDFAEADAPSDAHAFSMVSKMGQELTCDVATKENIEFDLEGNLSGRSSSFSGASGKSAELLGMMEVRERNEEPSSHLRNNSKCDIAPLEAAASLSACRSVSMASNSTGSRHLEGLGEGDVHTQSEPRGPEDAPEVFAEGRSCLERLKGLCTDTEDKCVLKEISEMLAGEDSAMRLSDTILFSAEKKLTLNEHEETMEARADVLDEVGLVNETADQMKNIEVEGVVSSSGSYETSLNNHVAVVEAIPDARDVVMLGNKVADRIANAEMEGEVASNTGVISNGHKEIAAASVCDLDRETELRKGKLLATHEADGCLMKSSVKDTASEGRCSVAVPLHVPACEKGIESTDEQDTERSAELLDVANNGRLAGDSVVENQYIFPDHAVEESAEDRTGREDLLVNMSIDKEGRPVLHETGEQLLENQIVCNKELYEDNEYYPTNAEETVAEGQTAYQNALDLEKENKTSGELRHIHPLSAVKTPKLQDSAPTKLEGLETIDKLVGGTYPDDQCAARADGSSCQDSKPLHEESAILAICSTDGANMSLCAKAHESSLVEIESDVCEPAAMEPRLSSDDRDNERLLELSLASDVNSAETPELPITQAIRPDSGANKFGFPAKEGAVEHNSNDETISGYKTCSEVLQTENSVGGHGFVVHCENEKEDVEQKGDVSEHKSSYGICSDVLQTENIAGGHDFVDLGENEKEDDEPNRHVSEQELSSEEESVIEKGDIADDKLEVPIPKELMSVEHDLDELMGEKSGKKPRHRCQTEVCEAMNLMAENDCNIQIELEQEENRPNLGLSEEKLDHQAEIGSLLEQNKEPVGERGLAVWFEPEFLVDESWGGKFDENLEHGTRNDIEEDVAMIFAEQLDKNENKDSSFNKQSSTSDHDYFAHVEGPAFESLEDMKITMTQQPDIEANLGQVQESCDFGNTVKDIKHEEEAGTAQDQEAVEIQSKEPKIQQHKDGYVAVFDHSHCHDRKDGLTHVTEQEATELYYVEAHTLEDMLELEAAKNIETSDGREDFVGQECADYSASVRCIMDKRDQDRSISNLTEPCTRGHEGEVADEFCRNTQVLEEMHLSGMAIDGNDDKIKLQLASFEEFIADRDLDARNNVDEGEKNSVYDKPLNTGKAEDGYLVNHLSYEDLSDGRKQPLANLNSAYEAHSEGAIGSLVEHIALDGIYDDDNHACVEEEGVIVGKDTNPQNLHNVEEENNYSKKDSTTSNGFATGDYSSGHDTVGSLAGEEGISDIFSGMQISSAKKNMITGRISCTPQRNQRLRDFLQIENMKENTPYSKTLPATNIVVEKSAAIPTSRRRALADLQNRIRADC